MKKLIALSLIVFSLYSCQEKLPTNIENALSWYEMKVDNVNEKDSLILSFKPEDIDKMTPDSISFILGSNEMSYNEVEKADKELKELLKYNPEYSDNEKIKNAKRAYRFNNLELFFNTTSYMENVIFYKESPRTNPKPIFGKEMDIKF
jgi:hypothetical protein